MELVKYLVSQGLTVEVANELAERKTKNPVLRGCSFNGKWVSLCHPNKERFDEMIESGVPPASSTDVEFMRGTENGRQFQDNPNQGDYYKRETEAAGGSARGKYLSQLARFPGDPEAWVQSRGDVQKVCENRGWGFRDPVGDREIVKPLDKGEPPPPPIPIADKCVDREVANVLEGQTVTKKEYKKVREQVREKLTPLNKRHLL
jgi:hypothetical protein